ncbi:hypothetical protein Pmani_019388 [Petrolisthes manimaculis]|uniref:Uncharacterized protein n=1 Tax=Petrolisthes manimaculis TaxID=1843537 RepID=A0AAE1U7G2_9EUCA|nr:hypothetical protein Pmani_019388 [Petrolisthes manimaculis]
MKCFLDDTTSIYDGAKAQGQTCALGPWPRDACPGDPHTPHNALTHLPGHPTYTLMPGAHRSQPDEWVSVVSVPRGPTLRQLQDPPGA